MSLVDISKTGVVLFNGAVGGEICALEAGFFRGAVLFETLRCYGGEVFRRGGHLGRLVESCRAFCFETPDLDLLEREVLAVSRGECVVGITVSASGARLVRSSSMALERIGREVTLGIFEVGVGATELAAHKHGSRGLWEATARRQGVDEVLLVSPAGELLEASSSNIIAVVDGAIVTPPLDGRQLPGVTRGAMLEAAGEIGLEVVERPLLADEELDELYLCSSLKELAPANLSLLNGRGEGPRVLKQGWGPMGAALHRAFQRLVERELELPAGSLNRGARPE